MVFAQRPGPPLKGLRVWATYLIIFVDGAWQAQGETFTKKYRCHHSCLLRSPSLGEPGPRDRSRERRSDKDGKPRYDQRDATPSHSTLLADIKRLNDDQTADIDRKFKKRMEETTREIKQWYMNEKEPEMRKVVDDKVEEVRKELRGEMDDLRSDMKRIELTSVE